MKESEVYSKLRVQKKKKIKIAVKILSGQK